MNYHRLLFLIGILGLLGCEDMVQVDDSDQTITVAESNNIEPDVMQGPIAEDIVVHKSIRVSSAEFDYSEDYTFADRFELAKSPSGETSVKIHHLKGVKSPDETIEAFCARLPFSHIPDLESHKAAVIQISDHNNMQNISSDRPLDVTLSGFSDLNSQIYGIQLPFSVGIDEQMTLEFITKTDVSLMDYCLQSEIKLEPIFTHLALWLTPGLAESLRVLVKRTSDDSTVFDQKFTIPEYIDESTLTFSTDSNRLVPAEIDSFPELTDWVKQLRSIVRFDPLNPPLVSFNDEYLLGFIEGEFGEYQIAEGPIETIECLSEEGYVDCPEGLHFSGGLLQWTPTISSKREYLVKIRIHDPAGYEPTDKEFLLKVKNANIPPTLTCGSTLLRGNAGDMVSPSCEASDADTDDTLIITVGGDCFSEELNLSPEELSELTAQVLAKKDCNLEISVTDGYAPTQVTVAVEALTYQITVNIPSVDNNEFVVTVMDGVDPIMTTDANSYAYNIKSGTEYSVAVLKQPESKFCSTAATNGVLLSNDLTIDFECRDPLPSKLSTGGDHSCILYDNNWVTCWGKGIYGQLGVGSTANVGSAEQSLGSIDPIHILTDDEFLAGYTITDISSGGDHSCVLISNGQMKCWGRGTYGQLGYGSTNHIGADSVDDIINAGYVPVDPLLQITSIALGENHSCAVLEDKSARCWGQGDFGKLGDGNNAANKGDSGGSSFPSEISNAGSIRMGYDVVEIIAGGVHTCAILEGNYLKCWGSGIFGSLGLGMSDDIGVTDYPEDHDPIELFADSEEGETITQVTAGKAHTCALISSGRLTCWGLNAFGQLGQGTNAVTYGAAAGQVPKDVVIGPFAETIVAVASGDSHNCVTLANGDIRCFGNGEDGRTGYGNESILGTAVGFTPTNANGLPGSSVYIAATPVAMLDLGFSHSCVVLTSGNVRCWGDNSFGQFGLNSNVPENTANEIPTNIAFGNL